MKLCPSSRLMSFCGRPVCFLAFVSLAFILTACKAPGQEFYVKRGDEFLKEGDYTNALAQYKLAVQTGEPNQRLYQAIARGHARLGQLDEAIVNYVSAAKLLARDGESVAAQIEMIQEPAEREFLIHLLNDRIKPYSSDVWFQLGMLFKTKQDDVKAVDAFRESLQWIPANLRSRMELALLLEAKMDLDAAITEWRQFLADYDKATTEEKVLYRVGKNDVADARARLNSLIARRSGVPAGSRKEQ